MFLKWSFGVFFFLSQTLGSKQSTQIDVQSIIPADFNFLKTACISHWRGPFLRLACDLQLCRGECPPRRRVIHTYWLYIYRMNGLPRFLSKKVPYPGYQLVYKQKTVGLSLRLCWKNIRLFMFLDVLNYILTTFK